jgi:hypothetical protein
MPLKSGIETILHRKFINFSFKAQNSHDRYSLSINFGKYIKKADYGDKQNFFGCNKISFNNFFFDKSMMKAFL